MHTRVDEQILRILLFSPRTGGIWARYLLHSERFAVLLRFRDFYELCAEAPLLHKGLNFSESNVGKELLPGVHKVNAASLEQAVKSMLQVGSIVGIEHDMQVERERNRCAAKFINAIHWLHTPGHSYLEDI